MAILREHYKVPTLGEIKHKLASTKVFSKLDAKNEFWSIKLDGESSFLSTFNTQYGRYRFLQLPFGLKCSQDIFLMRMDQILSNCPGVLAVHGDVTVYGANDAEHD